MNSPETFVKPSLLQLAPELFRLSRSRRIFTLLLPFLYVALYFVFAGLGWWPLAVLSLVALSFVTYGSISHDLVHRNLGLPKSMNDLFLSVIELLALRSGHAYRMAHLHHHARFPHSDDIEGAAAGMSFTRTMLEGVIFQFKIWFWAVKRPGKDRRLVLLEGSGCVLLVVLSLAFYSVTPVLLVYVVLMIMGSWIIPLITSYIPHNPEGANELLQTRLFRGKVLSVVALEHTYHLEHHLYPSVPHHNWPQLAKRLDPYFEAAGLKPIRLLF
jgi:beta-carotene hydroxylase